MPDRRSARRRALITSAEAAALTLDRSARPGRAEVVRSSSARLDGVEELSLLALEGRDTDIKTSRIKSGHRDILISSGAEISDYQATPTGTRWRLHFFPGELSHSLIVGRKPRSVLVDGKALEPSAGLGGGAAGWLWDEKSRRLYLAARHERETVQVEIVWQ